MTLFVYNILDIPPEIFYKNIHMFTHCPLEKIKLLYFHLFCSSYLIRIQYDIISAITGAILSCSVFCMAQACLQILCYIKDSFDITM